MTEDTIRIMELTKRVTELERMLSAPAPSPGSLHGRIIDTVAAHFGFKPGQLISSHRIARLAWARHLAIYFIDKYCGLNHSDIARIFKRDHAIVQYAIKRILDSIEVHAPSRAQVKFLEFQLEDPTFLNLRPSAKSAV